MLNNFMLNKGSEMIGKKWRCAVLWHLKDGPLRFSQLKSVMEDCSVKVLTDTLKDLESSGLIIREVYTGSMPIKVAYSLHADFIPFIDVMILYRNTLLEFINKRKDYLSPELILLLEQELLTGK